MANNKIPKAICLVLCCILYSACSTTINYVDVSQQNISDQKSIGQLACHYQLIAVNDQRQNTDNAGVLGLNAFTFNAPEEVVKAQLIKAGMLITDDGNSRDVVVDIKHVYMNATSSAKIPTVVYAVRILGQENFVIRGQAVAMNWNGTENEAYRSFSAAFQSANTQLVAKLNQGCRIE